ncbi:MAG: hypothetical protein AB1716_14375 [Planctomycetota bacterium]
MIKPVSTILVVLLAATASADVQIFFTDDSTSPWGTTGGAPPANVLAPSAGNRRDYGIFQGGEWLPGDGYRPNFATWPTAMSNVISGGEYAYIWIKFTADHNLPVEGAKLQGLDLILKRGTQTVPMTGGNEIAYYLQDNRLSEPPFNNMRWDGDPGAAYVNFKRNPQTLVAVTATGITNSSADAPYNLYHGATRTALLGAVHLPRNAVYTFELGPLGISFNTGGTPAVQFGWLTFYPEPAGVALFGLLGVFFRRR